MGWSGEVDVGDDNENEDEENGENERLGDEEDNDSWEVKGREMKKVWEGEIMFNRSDEDDESNEEGVSLGRVVGREGKEKKVRCVKPDGYWNGRRFGTVFRRESKKRMAQDMGLSVWRDAYVAFHRMDAYDVGVGKLLKKMENGDLEFGGGLEEDDDVEEYRSKQLAHSRMVKLNAYAGSNMEF